MRGPPTATRLAQLLFLAGHVALRVCSLLEKLQLELKQLRHLQKDPQQQQQQQQGGTGDSDSAIAEQRQRQQQQQQQQQEEEQEQQQQQQQQVERNLGMQTREEEEIELMQHVIEHEVTQKGLLGGPYKRLILIAAFDPMQLIQRLQPKCTDTPNGGGGGAAASSPAATAAAARLLQQAAVLSLCKYATVSKAFCDEALGGRDATILHALISLLFAKEGGGPPGAPARLGGTSGGILQQEGPPAGLKDAILVCFGDLTCR